MDDACTHTRTLAILNALAEGVHPQTGEVFPTDSPYYSPEVIRALYNAIRMLDGLQSDSRTRSQVRPRSGAPTNAGKLWNEDEDRRLLAEFDAGKSLKELAGLHQRTYAGIEARLEKLGRLKPEERTTARRVPPQRASG